MNAKAPLAKGERGFGKFVPLPYFWITSRSV